MLLETHTQKKIVQRGYEREKKGKYLWGEKWQRKLLDVLTHDSSFFPSQVEVGFSFNFGQQTKWLYFRNFFKTCRASFVSKPTIIPEWKIKCER